MNPAQPVPVVPQSAPQPPVEPVAQANLGVAPAPQTTAAGGHPEVEGSKEITAPIEIIPEQPEISPELQEHIEAVQHGEIQLPGPIDVGTHEGQQVTISPAAPQQPNIVLPLTQSDFVTGQKQPMTSSWRWLYEFVKRIILMMPGRTMYNS